MLYDFRLFLAERFGATEIEEEEANRMFDQPETIHDVLKLNAVLEGLRQKAGKKTASQMEITKDETGFYMKKGRRDLFFVGCWQTFWNDGNKFPLCFGIEDDSPLVKQAFSTAFTKAYQSNAIPFGGWTMGWVPKEELQGSGDSVERIWAKINPIWQAVSKAAG